MVGAGGHCRVIMSLLTEVAKQYSVEGVFDLQSPREDENVLGIPVVGHYSDLLSFPKPGSIAVFIAIGDNLKREMVFQDLLVKGFQIPNLFSASAVIHQSVKFGRGNVFCHQCFIGPLVQIGDNGIINTNCVVEHETIIGDNCHVAPGAVIAGRVKVGDNVFVGLGAKIVDNVSVSSDIIVGAGAVVNKDLKEKGRYAGVPAKRMR